MNKLIPRRNSLSEPIMCPACQLKVYQGLYEYLQPGFSSQIFKCDNCSFMFSRPVFIEDLSCRSMESVDDAEMFGSPLMKSLYEKWFLRRELKEVTKRLSVEKPRLLDIGCGTGWTTSFWDRNGFDVQGLEPSRVRSKIAAERYGLSIENDYLESYKPEKLYDVVLMRHSLEHFENPYGALCKINSLLNDSGVVLLVVPNIDCLGRRLFGIDWEWVLPWHCNFFNPESLRAILECAGFEDDFLFQTPSPLYVLDSLGRKLNTGFFTHLRERYPVTSMTLSAPFALAGNVMRMGDNVTAVARKSSM